MQNEISCRPNINRISMKWQTAAYELPWFRNCAALQEITNNDFRILLPEIFLFWTFLNLIIHLCPKNQLLSVIHCLTASSFGLFLNLIIHLCPKIQLLSSGHSLTASYLGLFPDLIVHLCPKSRRIMYGENRRREFI